MKRKENRDWIKIILFGIAGGFIFLLVGIVALMIGTKTENEILLFYPFKIADFIVSKLFSHVPSWEGFFYVSIIGLIINFFTGFIIGLLLYHYKNKK